MRFKRLDLNLLAALDVLIRTKSVSQAADEMFLTQSAMSSALKRLRDFFDDPLLVPVGRGMELSPLAEQLREPLREIIMRIEHTMTLNPHFDPATAERAFSVVMSDYVMTVLGDRLVRRVAEEAPGISLDLRPQTARPGGQVARGEVDLVIMPDAVRTPGLACAHLFDDHLRVIACADGPYGGRPLTLDEFCTARHVLVEPHTEQESHSTLVMRQADVSPKKAIVTYSFASVPQLVRGTDMIALVQGGLARIAAAQGGLTVSKPPITCPPLRETMRWRPHRSGDPGLTWLRDCVMSLARPITGIYEINT